MELNSKILIQYVLNFKNKFQPIPSTIDNEQYCSHPTTRYTLSISPYLYRNKKFWGFPTYRFLAPSPRPPRSRCAKKIASHWLMYWCAKKSRLSLVRRATQCRQLRTRSYELACIRQHLCTDSSCGFDCTVHSLRLALHSEPSQGVELSLGVYHRLG